MIDFSEISEKDLGRVVCNIHTDELSTILAVGITAVWLQEKAPDAEPRKLSRVQQPMLCWYDQKEETLDYIELLEFMKRAMNSHSEWSNEEFAIKSDWGKILLITSEVGYMAKVMEEDSTRRHPEIMDHIGITVRYLYYLYRHLENPLKTILE